jgi:hypothetical protein
VHARDCDMGMKWRRSCNVQCKPLNVTRCHITHITQWLTRTLELKKRNEANGILVLYIWVISKQIFKTDSGSISQNLTQMMWCAKTVKGSHQCPPIQSSSPENYWAFSFPAAVLSPEGTRIHGSPVQVLNLDAFHSQHCTCQYTTKKTTG